MDPTIFIQFPLTVLKTVGLRMIRTPNDKERYKFQAGWLFIISISNLLFNIIGQFNEVWLGIRSGGPLNSWVIHIVASSFMLSAISKAILIVLKSQCFSVLLNELNCIFPTARKDQKQYHLNDYLRKLKKISLAIGAIQLILGFYYGLNTMLVDYYTPRAANETHNLILPFGDHYPFYSHTQTQFILMTISQFWSGQTCTALSFAVNTFVIGLVWQLCMHYNHLKDKLKCFDETESENSEKEHLIWCIKKQNQLDEVFDQLNNACSLVTMFGLMCVCIELVLFCFMGITLTKPTDYIFNVVGALSAILESFALCSFSQILTDSTIEAKQAIYESNWTNKSVNYRRAMVLMIQQNNRTITLKAYKFADLSIEMFGSILKFSYRLVTLLLNTSQ